MKYIKWFTLLIFTLIILLIFVLYPKDDIKKLQNKAINNFSLIESSIERIKLDNNYILYFISDSIGNIHYFLYYKNNFITTKIIGNNNSTKNYYNERDIYWTYFTKPGEYSLLAGTIVDNSISHIEVNEVIPNKINYIDYYGCKLFYSTEHLDTPILIKGYSLENDLIFKNF
ncbi:hypothetical protein ACF3MZ_26875 [Paenibacillaceae bacterium WGS1546]|uniref:hypothetical protein n=1 Tax=Cohnella sp. WGS1546 TaxID=3366810 RepID=UPI00372D42B0